jgi:hypothetical protein
MDVSSEAHSKLGLMHGHTKRSLGYCVEINYYKLHGYQIYIYNSMLGHMVPAEPAHALTTIIRHTDDNH